MRIKMLQKLMQQKKLDISLIINFEDNINLKYFTGFEGAGILAITKTSFLLVPEMEYERAQKTGMKVFKVEKKRHMLENLQHLLKRHKMERVGVEEKKITLFLYKKLKKALKGRYLGISDLCSQVRMVKDDDEISNIRHAASVTDNVFRKLCSFKFKTEKEVEVFISSEIRKKGCELAFPPIVASGKNSSMPHFIPNDRLRQGFLLLDFGARYNGYCSDMTRMLYLGKPSKKELDHYNLVLETQQKCLQNLPKKFSTLYKRAVRNLGDKSEYFTHSLGHGVGLDIHEAPSLSPDDKNRVQDNIAFTVEPGIYLPGKYGIRIEDTVLIQNNKLEILTKSKKDLVVI